MAGLAAATALTVEDSPIAAAVVFAFIAFHLALGWKTDRLARAPQPGLLEHA